MNKDNHRLRILICIGGGPEAFTGLKFAARLSQQSCSSIALLYVRPLDSGLKSGGMDISVARENILEWGLELPGMAHLNKARDILAELGEITRESSPDWSHLKLSGDPVGEYIREYQNPCGGTISLRLRTATDVTTAVIDEADRFNADLIIVGASPDPTGLVKKILQPKQLALKIASHSDHSIIVARHLEPGHGHLVCVQDTDRSRSMLPKAVQYGHACNCPISFLSVAEDEQSLQSAIKAVNESAQFFRDNGIEPHELLTEIGDPAKLITKIGYDFSLILMAESGKPWFAKSFSVAHDVASMAKNSVLIVK
jgi:nucleotide-binding universal stress UspA family protein